MAILTLIQIWIIELCDVRYRMFWTFQYVNVSFTSFGVENDDSCAYDRLSIYDAENEHGPLRAVLCGHDLVSGLYRIVSYESIGFMGSGELK